MAGVVALIAMAVLFREQIGRKLDAEPAIVPMAPPERTFVEELEAPKEDEPVPADGANAEEAIGAALVRQLRAGSVEEARATFGRLRTSDDPEEVAREDTMFEYWRWRHGDDARGLDRLQSLLKDRHVGPLAGRLIAEGNAELGQVELAIPQYEAAIAASKRPDDLSAAVTGLANTLIRLGRRNEAAALLSRWVSKVGDSSFRTTLVGELAGIYRDSERWLYRAAALEVALEANPNDATSQFDAAYAYSQAGREDLALLHYKAALELDGGHRPAINNLGVAYDRLGMSLRAVTEYKRAADLDESLGKANLALAFLNAGFLDEAATILHAASEDPNAHESVAAHLDVLAARIEQENAVEEAALHSANELREFFRKVGRALTDSNTLAVGGSWRHNATRTPAHIGEHNGMVVIEFGEPKRRTRMSGHRTNNAIDLKVEQQQQSSGTAVATIGATEVSVLLFEDTVPPRIERFARAA
jgi:Flp pilus assembly protein TadD